ncbi:MAG TPA: PucR family transcriptional regulator, partial [Thermoanaerobacterales bacterium]|nr:PucR family transcriptional regulator [Thermoanaerobacterales bacterium]
VNIGIGRYYDNITKIQKSYNEAQNALIVSKKLLNGENTVLHFDDLGIYKLLTKLEDKEDLEIFYKETLYPLSKYDEENRTDLVRTLQEYFVCGENLTVTAKKLYVHVNTLKYRMNRIKEILYIDDFTMENKTSLYIALKIADLLDKK